MANKNTNLGGGKLADSGVMNSPDASRARTRTRGMSYGDINNIPLVVIPRACARIRARTCLYSCARAPGLQILKYY